jgi:hypothetical protein
MSLQLFLELMAAKSNLGVRAVLDDFALDHGFANLLDLPCRHFGDKENNRGPVEAMESTDNALYEKVMNGFDAVIEFNSAPRVLSPTQSMPRRPWQRLEPTASSRALILLRPRQILEPGACFVGAGRGKAAQGANPLGLMAARGRLLADRRLGRDWRDRRFFLFFAEFLCAATPTRIVAW